MRSQGTEPGTIEGCNFCQGQQPRQIAQSGDFQAIPKTHVACQLGLPNPAVSVAWKKFVPGSIALRSSVIISDLSFCPSHCLPSQISMVMLPFVIASLYCLACKHPFLKHLPFRKASE